MTTSLFPIPRSGTVEIIGNERTFAVVCRGFDHDDNAKLHGFFKQIRDRSHEFRFEHAGRIHPRVCFDSGSVTFVQTGPATYNVTVPMEVL